MTDTSFEATAASARYSGVLVNPVPVYMSGFAHRLGAQVELSEIDDAVLRRELPQLHEAGMEYCRVAQEGRTALAAASARHTLSTAGRLPDGLVYCTDTVVSSPTLDAQDLLQTLPGAIGRVLVVGGSACGNLGPALETSAAWLATGCLDSVLMVTADEAGNGGRYLESSQAALSDGAASCRISNTHPAPGFRVLAQMSASAAHDGTPASPSLTLRHTAARVERVASAVTRATGGAVGDYRHVLTGNLGPLMRAFLAMAAHVPADRVHAPRIATTGHCFAADILMGLQILVEEQTLTPGDRLLLLPTSPRSCSAIAVEYVEAE